MDSSDLKPCPFCGSEILGIAEEDGFYAVICGTCEARGGVRDEQFLAINAWNHRFGDSTTEDVDNYLY